MDLWHNLTTFIKEVVKAMSVSFVSHKRLTHWLNLAIIFVYVMIAVSMSREVLIVVRSVDLVLLGSRKLNLVDDFYDLLN